MAGPVTAYASAPGKINLLLSVGAPDASGYHPLTSVFEAVSLREYVAVRVFDETRQSSEPRISVNTSVYSSPGCQERPSLDTSATRGFAEFDGPGHLGVKAAAQLLPPGLAAQIRVHKTLPVAGGMAGGSADAAATLVALNQAADLKLGSDQLASIARSLGADVPACLTGGISLGLGRGDEMTRLAPGTNSPSADSRWWVALFSNRGLSTPKVFSQFDRIALPLEPVPESEAPGKGIAKDQLRQIMKSGAGIAPALTNDLAEAAFTLRPELRDLGNACESQGAVAWMLSGSGPTILALGKDESHACELAANLREQPGVSSVAVMWGAGEGARLEPRLPSWCVH